MKKIKLDIDALAVETFETGGEKGHGTVLARSGTSMFPIDPSCFGCYSLTVCEPSNEPMRTCYATCATRCGTCYCG